jgi:hypothetical protein
MSARNPVRRSLLLAAAVLALPLAGCDKPAQKNSSTDTTATTQAAAAPAPLAALPLAAGPATASAPAPTAAALPKSKPVRYAKPDSDRYAYLDRAYSMSRTLGDAPPDYTYDYGQQQPFVWRSDDGYQRIAEQLPDGGMRYYYYQPGADEPYLVQDPQYSYAYSNGALTVIYDSRGRILEDEFSERQGDIAGRYLARAEALYSASVREQHEAAAAENWNRQRDRIYEDRQRWRDQQDQDPDWRAYHDAHRQDEQSHWAMERYRRAAEAARTAQTISDAVAAARAAQALEDASAEARRYGHDVGPGQPPGGAPPPRGAAPWDRDQGGRAGDDRRGPPPPAQVLNQPNPPANSQHPEIPRQPQIPAGSAGPFPGNPDHREPPRADTAVEAPGPGSDRNNGHHADHPGAMPNSSPAAANVAPAPVAGEGQRKPGPTIEPGRPTLPATEMPSSHAPDHAPKEAEKIAPQQGAKAGPIAPASVPLATNGPASAPPRQLNSTPAPQQAQPVLADQHGEQRDRDRRRDESAKTATVPAAGAAANQAVGTGEHRLKPVDAGSPPAQANGQPVTDHKRHPKAPGDEDPAKPATPPANHGVAQ